MHKKKRYTTPCLTEHGSLVSLTLQGGTNPGDVPAGDVACQASGGT